MMEGRPTSPEAALRSLARALAPYIAEELRRLEALERATLSPGFDEATCVRFVEDLGDGVLARARMLFELLDRDGVVDSVALAETVGITPRELSGYLTTPLKRRAAALKLPLPFSGGLGGEQYGGIPSPSPDMDPQRTHWQDRDGIARRMLAAIALELDTRSKEEQTTVGRRRRA
jgi:hypothetical protein